MAICQQLYFCNILRLRWTKFTTTPTFEWFGWTSFLLMRYPECIFRYNFWSPMKSSWSFDKWSIICCPKNDQIIPIFVCFISNLEAYKNCKTTNSNIFTDIAIMETYVNISSSSGMKLLLINISSCKSFWISGKRKEIISNGIWFSGSVNNFNTKKW